MRILVASTYTPLMDGGARKLAAHLTGALQARGHEAEQLLFPFLSDPDRMLEQMLAIRLTDISHACDLLIALRTPIYLLRHPNKVLWFLHHHRGAYDLWGTPFGDIQDTPQGRRLRRALRAADDLAFKEAQSIYAISASVAERMRVGNGVKPGVLYPPLAEDSLRRATLSTALASSSARAPVSGDYVFFPSRIAGNKRQRLAIESMSQVQSGVRLVLAGAADTPHQLDALKALIAEHRLEQRVQLIGRWVSEEEKRALMAGSLATVYVPFEEDYGYVALESLEAGKPVITCSDSGGPLELIVDGQHGIVAQPTAHEIGAAIDRLARDRALVSRMGAAARGRPAELGIGWDAVVGALVK